MGQSSRITFKFVRYALSLLLLSPVSNSAHVDLSHRRNPLTVLLSHLLQLVSTSIPQSVYRTSLTSHLTALLLRPGGVRSLLIVVVGIGGEEEETVSEKKAEMVWRLLGNHSGQKDSYVCSSFRSHESLASSL